MEAKWQELLDKYPDLGYAYIAKELQIWARENELGDEGFIRMTIGNIRKEQLKLDKSSGI